MFKKYVFQSQNPGYRFLFLGAVHGNETAGTLAQQQIIKMLNEHKLRLIKGSVTFIPVVNEAAHKKDCRFVDVNLNRVVCKHAFPCNNEERIANLLTQEIDNCDIMIDLHSTHCPKDEAFAFIDYPSPDNQKVLSVIPVRYALAGWPAIYAKRADISNFCTESYAHSQGKIGLTVECGYHKSPQSVKIAQNSILNVLASFGCIDMPKPLAQSPEIITLDSYVIKPSEGNLSRSFSHLDYLPQGTTIAQTANGQTFKSSFDGYIIMPNPEANIGSEWFYLGRKQKPSL